MNKRYLAVHCFLFLLGACSADQEMESTPSALAESSPVADTPVAPAAPSSPVALFDTGESIRDLMNNRIQPHATALWQAVRYVATAEGVEEDVQPRTEEDWADLRASALELIAAGNALLITERAVDTEYPRADYPEYTYKPDEIRQLIAADTETWRYFIEQMQFATNATLETITNRDVIGLIETGATINNACQGCHGTFWYRPLNP